MVLSTAIVGTLSWLTLGVLGIEVSLLYALVFGALISPTDPVAVLGILKRAGAPKRLETLVTGESLFNDGVGVVLFVALLGLAQGHEGLTTGHVALLLAEETGGGILLGLGLGLVAYRLLKGMDNHQVEILVTLAVVTGGFALADALHVSGPIAMVVAGLLVGNQGRAFAMSEHTRQRLDTFWELMDDMLNAVLFLLLGLEVLIVPKSPRLLAFGALAVVAVLVARLASVAGIASLPGLRRRFVRGSVPILAWGGLRGGISVALALSIPETPARDPILAGTYAVVVVSIIVQGLTIGRLVSRVSGAAREARNLEFR